jgi:hypothetical protein
VVVVVAPSACGQDASQQNAAPRNAAEDEPQDVLKIDTDLVPVDVIATDAKRRLGSEPDEDDFKLLKTISKRPIASFNVETDFRRAAPLAIVFASMFPAA